MTTMLAPVIKKISVAKDVYTERVLPVPGQILVQPGDKVSPYDHIGLCTFSQKNLRLPRNFRPQKLKKNGQFYYLNSFLGSMGRKKIDAPYNGNLFRTERGIYEFKEESKKYALLAGVWGEVVKTVEGNAVLLKVNMKELNLVVATKNNFAGELVVFPNPTHLLEKFYLEGFTAGSTDGKIVYVGNHVSLNFLKEAVKYGLGAVIGGSADRETYKYALRSGISFGLFNGFGDIPTPENVYSVLTNVSNRYVFFQGNKNMLRIPLPFEEKVDADLLNNSDVIAEVKSGSKVVVLQRPYFGKPAIVDSVAGYSILVRFGSNEKPVEIYYPNFFMLS